MPIQVVLSRSAASTAIITAQELAIEREITTADGLSRLRAEDKPLTSLELLKTANVLTKLSILHFISQTFLLAKRTLLYRVCSLISTQGCRLTDTPYHKHWRLLAPIHRQGRHVHRLQNRRNEEL